MKEIFDKAIVFQNDNEWKNARMHMSHTFTSGRLKTVTFS